MTAKGLTRTKNRRQRTPTLATDEPADTPAQRRAVQRTIDDLFMRGEGFHQAFPPPEVKSESLRSTVPEVVAALLDLKPGDTLYWMVESGATQVTVTRRPPRHT